MRRFKQPCASIVSEGFSANEGASAVDKGTSALDKGTSALDEGASTVDRGALAVDEGASAVDLVVEDPAAVKDKDVAVDEDPAAVEDEAVVVRWWVRMQRRSRTRLWCWIRN